MLTSRGASEKPHYRKWQSFHETVQVIDETKTIAAKKEVVEDAAIIRAEALKTQRRGDEGDCQRSVDVSEKAGHCLPD